MAAICLLLGQSVLALLLGIPAAVFLVRSFIVFHDCTHGSFFASRRANAWLGRSTGLLLYSPFHRWRHDHAVHHATAGDLDRRGTGDLHTLTVAEYGALAWKGRLGYRLMRNPLILIGRRWLEEADSVDLTLNAPKEATSVHVTSAAGFAVGQWCW